MLVENVLISDIDAMCNFFRLCYKDSNLFFGSDWEYDDRSVRESLISYLNSGGLYIVKKIVEGHKIIGAFIVVISPFYMNLLIKICVEFFVRPAPDLNRVLKGKVMIRAISEIEEEAKKNKCKAIHFNLENNNGIAKHLEKRGYVRKEIVMAKEVD